MAAARLSLLDLILPYVFQGQHLGTWHAALSAIAVDRFDAHSAPEGSSLRGRALFDLSARPYVDPARGQIGFQASTGNHPHDDPTRRDPWIDFADNAIDFELFAQRTGSALALAALPAPGTPVNTLLTALDPPPLEVASDFAGTQFVLDLVVSTLVLRLPFLKGAKLRPDDGLLEPDADHPNVAITFPRLKLRLMQDAAGVLTLDLLSVGTSGLDDAGDIGVAELLRMDPPYAFIGDSRIVGFGFRRAVLDLSDGSTPPDVLAQFGYDEHWKGLYLPEVRLFIAPNGMRDLAVSAGATNLLIGLQDTPGVTGDFDLSIINQGGALSVSVRFFAEGGRVIGFTPTGSGRAEATLPPRTRMVIDATGARPPYTYSARLGTGNLTAVAGLPNTFDIDIGSAASTPLRVQVSSGSASSTLELTLRPRSTSTGSSAGGGAASPPAEVTISTTSITMGGTAVASPEFLLVAQTATHATIGLSQVDADGRTRWTVDGVAQAAPSDTVTVAVAAGGSVALQAQRDGSGGGSQSFTGYFRFDRPSSGQHTSGSNAAASGHSYCLNTGNVATQPAASARDDAGFPGGQPFAQQVRAAVQALPAGTAIAIVGEASNEGDAADAPHNLALSERRAAALAEIIRHEAGHDFSFSISGVGAVGGTTLAERRRHWAATATFSGPASPATLTTGMAARAAAPAPPAPPTVADPTPTQPAPPDWFRALGAKLRIVRDEFVALELWGEFDIDTATEGYLREHAGEEDISPDIAAMGDNATDGIIRVRIVFQIDNATGQWSAVAAFGADPADRDGLMMTGQLPGQSLKAPDFGRNLLGMTLLFWPLLDATAPANPASGDVVPAVLSGVAIGVATALAQAGWFNIERVVWYGGELAIRHVQGVGDAVSLLFDVETALSADVELGGIRLLTIPRQQPLVVRYKAIGMRFGNVPGERDFQFRPVFDSSRGFSIDLSSPGAVQIPDPLGQIIRILGARIARTNPLSFEFDLGFAVDLGVITIERARIRLTVDTAVEPHDFGVQLTAFGAGVDIPGALVGHGYMEFGEEIGGQLDLTLVPISTRIAAGIKIANIPASEGGPATGVIVSLEVELPVAIPLGGSGLGIYGFLGLFAMHYGRDERGLENSAVPALAWLKDRAEGNPVNLRAWRPQIDKWAFGVGAILGTMGSKVVFNLKGVLLLELPGPRILLVMKARLLQEMPALGDKNAEGNLLAVIDLDAARGTLTIGIAADYTIDPLLKIRIPIEAFFDFNNASNWHIYIGKYDDPIQASIFEVIGGSAYLMLSGHGIPAHDGLPATTGFSIATGLRASIVWGNVPARLYVRVAAGFDAVVGFEPFRVTGKLFIRGEMVLFIISISAWADLTVDVGEEVLPDGRRNQISRIDGQVCGEIDCFFFSIKGCVEFHLGATSLPALPPPPLVRDMKLISRSPALVVGSGVDRGIDTGLGSGTATANDAAIPVVPIDAIPVLLMSAPPLDDALTIFGEAPLGAPGTSDGWSRRGATWLHYDLQSVQLIGAIGSGPKPSVWWTPLAPASDENADVQLAILSWVPNATPQAFTRSRFQEETVTDRWETVCDPAAPATSVLWTFERERLGPSPQGWLLDGEAWPDPAGSVRSQPPRLELKVTERWRCGVEAVDELRGILAAEVVGAPVACPKTETTTPPAPTRRDEVVRQALAVENSVLARLKQPERLADVATTFTDLMGRLRTGEAVGRGELLRTDFSAPVARRNDPPRDCVGKVLASPAPDDRRPVVLGNALDEPAIKQTWSAVGFKPSPLADAIELHSGAVEAGRVLLFVLEALVKTGRVVLRLLDAKGGELSRQLVEPADVVPTRPLPPTWTDASGPWAREVQLAAAYYAHLPSSGAAATVVATGANRLYVPALVLIKGHPEMQRIEIGVLPQGQDDLLGRVLLRPYYLAVVELMHSAEVRRFHSDSNTVTRNQGAAAAALSPDSADWALLEPDTVYEVRAAWQVHSVQQEARPTSTSGLTPTSAQESFFFRTDNKPPRRLDPWVLATLPAEGEQHVFTADALTLIFGTPIVLKLYSAYGKKLQVRIKAANFRRPRSTTAVPHPFPLRLSSAAAIPAKTLVPDATAPGGFKQQASAVLTPFEEVLGELVDSKECIAGSGERTRHIRFDIPVALEPYTDYLLDIESVPAGAGADEPGEVVFRRSFTAGAYASAEAFAHAFVAERPTHRHVQAAGIATLRGLFIGRDPQGPELDTALQACGLEPSDVPREPRVVALWASEGGALPEPVAVLVDGNEPMRRWRRLPARIADAGSNQPQRFEMRERACAWLATHVPSGAEPPVDDVVERVIYAPGAQRAVVLLKPGSRGKLMQLGLHVDLFQNTDLALAVGDPPVADASYRIAYVPLLRAPWEE